jgi:hypothetical protein
MIKGTSRNANQGPDSERRQDNEEVNRKAGEAPAQPEALGKA